MKSLPPSPRTREPKKGALPYEPPAIVSREKLEVIAAVCSPGKGPLDLLPDCFVNTNS